MFFAVGVVSLNEMSIYTPDSTRYLVWAKSLSQMDGYYDSTLPEAARYVVHAPLYSLLLAPVSFLVPESIIAPKILTLIFGVAALILIYVWLRSFAGPAYAFVGSAILAVNPLVLLYSSEVLSDIPFITGLVLVCILMPAVVKQAERRTNIAVVLACTVTAAMLLREIGISIVLAVVLFLVYKRKFKEAVITFSIPALIYAGWYIRNELIVAAVEQPVLTNAKMFSYHFFTPNNASLVEEFIARISNNAGVYAKLIGDLLLFPMYIVPQYDLVSGSEPLIPVIKSVLEVAKYPVVAFLGGAIAYGAYHDVRGSETGLFRVLFLALYAAVMLLYPINDIRFLMPFMVLMVYYIVAALLYLSERITIPGHNKVLLSGILVGLCLLPNVVWDYYFVKNSYEFTSDPVRFYESGKSMKDYPTHFTKPFRQAGEWIKEFTHPQTVLVSQWKDIAFWIGERKLINMDQTISPDEFENLIRDYNVGFLVSQLKRGGIPEFAFQMHVSRRYRFVQMHRVGNTEIYGIYPKRHSHNAYHDSSSFIRSLNAFDVGNYDEALGMLDSLWRENDRNLTALFHLAVVKECSGGLREADSLFSLLREHPQAGIFLGKAGTHRQIIRQLEALSSDTSSARRSETLINVGMAYWNMGLRTEGRKTVTRAQREDPSSAPAMIFQSFFALKEQDTMLARISAAELRTAHPDHPVGASLDSIFALFDAISVTNDSLKRAQYFFHLAERYLSVGLVEDAIDHALLSIQHDGRTTSSLLFLAELYIKKRRFLPAKKLLQSVLDIEPHHEQARVLLSNLF